MHHLVRERRQNFGDGTVTEVRRIESDFVGEDTVSTAKPVTDKIAIGAPPALQRDKGIGEGVFEQRAIERLVGELQGIVSLARRLCCLSVCVGHWNLRFALPDSGPLWDVHHSVGMFTTRSNFDLSGDIAKMEQANSAFPRTNLAVWIVVCITEHEERAAVLARLNFFPVQSKYGRTEPIAIGTRCARYYRPARTLRGDCASPVRPPAATPKLTRRLATRLLRGWVGRSGIEP